MKKPHNGKLLLFLIADPARFLPPIWHQIALHRSCSVSAANLTSNCVAQVLLGFCCQSAVMIPSKSCSVSATNLLSNYVNRFCNISAIIWRNRFCIQSAVFLRTKICSRRLVKSIRTDFVDWIEEASSYLWLTGDAAATVQCLAISPSSSHLPRTVYHARLRGIRYRTGRDCVFRYFSFVKAWCHEEAHVPINKFL
jgi:hypothetical protein